MKPNGRYSVESSRSRVTRAGLHWGRRFHSVSFVRCFTNLLQALPTLLKSRALLEHDGMQQPGALYASATPCDGFLPVTLVDGERKERR